jgi:hypothetical protein
VQKNPIPQENKMARPYFKNLSDDSLREAYAATKALLWNASQMRAAGSVIRLSDDLDLIVNVARKRGLALTTKAGA